MDRSELAFELVFRVPSSFRWVKGQALSRCFSLALALAHCRACHLLFGTPFSCPTRLAVVLLPAAIGGMANAINLDNEAALNMDKLYKSQPMQVGPLAQVLIGHAQGHKLTLK